MTTIRFTIANWRRLLRLWAVLCLALLATPAHAECKANPDDFDPLSYGSPATDSSVPIGGTIGTPQHWQYHLMCRKKADGQPLPEQVSFIADYGVIPGTDLWATKLPGVGARVRANGTVVSANRSYMFNHPGDGSTESFDMSMELVKVGPVRPTHFADYIFQLKTTSTPEGTHTIGDEHVVDTMFNGTACTIAQDSKQKIVNMGTWAVSNFSGVGSVVGKRPLTMNLRCDTTGEPMPMPLSISLDGTTITGNDSVLQVTGNPAATGIGIQLSNPGTGEPYPLNKWIRINDGATPGNYPVNMDAAYYQFGDKVTPGEANGIVTFEVDMR
jgi:type 1 fimbria pilin